MASPGLRLGTLEPIRKAITQPMARGNLRAMGSPTGVGPLEVAFVDKEEQDPLELFATLVQLKPRSPI